MELLTETETETETIDNSEGHPTHNENMNIMLY